MSGQNASTSRRTLAFKIATGKPGDAEMIGRDLTNAHYNEDLRPAQDVGVDPPSEPLTSAV